METSVRVGCVIIGFLFHAVCSVHGQTALQEFKSILTQYRQDRVNLDYRMSFSYFEGGAKLPSDTMSVWFTQNGTDFRMKASNFEWLKQGNQLLWVDHEKQEMVLQSAQQSGNVNYSLEQLEKLVMSEDFRLGMYKNGKGEKVLHLADPDDSDTSIDVVFDPNTHFILRTVYSSLDSEDPSESVRWVVTYRNYKRQTGGFSCSMKNYLSLSGKHYQVSKRFRNYVLQVI